MQPLTAQDVQKALHAYGFDIQLLQASESTATSELAAAAIGCEVAQIAKSICLMVDKDQPVLVVASGTQTVDDRKIATIFEVGRKKVKLAKPQECIEIFGYPPGGVPPVGHRTAGIPIYLDNNLRQFERVYAAAGTANINFGITCEELGIITKGTWADVVKD
jgi:prolyl-tRNA editing enzyme YbaK/EbsC (Cys-tRNA(Pro) deacylase)